MNSLNLRVSSVKTGENVKKNAEMRTSLMNIPLKYKCRSEEFVTLFKEANNIQNQVEALKKIYLNMDDNREALLFLADLYFYGPPKHPVRNQIIKLLQNGAKTSEDVIEQLRLSLQYYMLETNKNLTSCSINEFVTSLMGCFENFKCALKALERNLDIVFPFLCDSIEKYFLELRFKNSPSARNEYYLFIHNSVRLILSCIQEFPSLIGKSHELKLRYLNNISQHIISHIDIPMDTKSNAGILMAYIARNFDEYDIFIKRSLEPKEPSEIALCVGIVNTFSNLDFQRVPDNIFQVIEKILDIAKVNTSIPNILFCASRALFQMSKSILCLDIKDHNIIHNVQRIHKVLLNFTFFYLDHHMDSVRHTSRDILRNVIRSANINSDEKLLFEIFRSCNSDDNSVLFKSIVLLQVSIVLGTKKVLAYCKNIFSELFDSYLGVDIQVNNLFEGLMIKNYTEVIFEEWRDLWIVYLLKIVCIKDNRMSDVETLIRKSIKCDSRIVNFIIEENQFLPISTKLSASWALRKNGMGTKDFSNILERFGESFQNAIVSECDETKIMALRLIVESHKTTELLSELECKYILLYVKYNANTQSPATRQKAMGLLKKALDRLNLNIQHLLKSSPKSNHYYFKFFNDLIRMLAENLFAGANFSRRSVSLQLLKKVIEIGFDNKLSINEILNKKLINNIVNNLEDTYEANKAITVTILKMIENFNGEKISNSLTIERIRNYMISVRPTDSVTAAYWLDFFCNSLDNNKAMKLFEISQEINYKPIIYMSILWVLRVLRKGLDMAKKSILLAAKLNPLYGSCFTIKHLLSDLDFQELSKHSSWRVLIADLLTLCKELTEVVAPVVNSSSPEGHLPNDFSDFPKHLSDLNNKENGNNCKILSKKISINIDDLKTTPQMVLICAWRTVKDVSLILGDIVLKSPIKFNENTKDFLITTEQIIGIGEHFKELLSETKHRGAFEQAYVGFSKLCTRLWRVDCSTLNDLPKKWLSELLEIISKDEKINDKICATRRSAGVPFMVQALITSELQVGTTTALKICMNNLLCLSSDPDRSTESRTHALNILRALFRCTDLNEVIGEFIAEGIIRAINGYEANTWSEKNSSTLLFAALITRIFGVQITKDYENLNIRNKMTGRIFFLKYPELYDYFLTELEKASELVLCNQKANKLHPLLLILSRLYPSALEGTESNLKLSEFISLIAICSGGHEMQTRLLAAKSIVALILIDKIPNQIELICNFITPKENKKVLPLNIIHGHLLQMYYLTKSLKALTVELIAIISFTLTKIHSSLETQNAVIVKISLDITVEMLKRFAHLNVPKDVIKSISYFSTQDQFYEKQFNLHYPVLQKSLLLYNLYLMRLLTLPSESIVDLLIPTLCQEQVGFMGFEDTEVKLNIIILIINKTQCEEMLVEELEISEIEIDFFNALSCDLKQELQLKLTKNKSLQQIIKAIIENKLYYPMCTMKSYAILSQMISIEYTLDDLHKQTLRYPSDMKSALAMCVKKIVQANLNNFSIAQQAMEYLHEISKPWYPDVLRLIASEILSDLSIHFKYVFKVQNKKFIKDFIKIAINLMMDDNSEVRRNTSKIVLLMNCKHNQSKEGNIVSTYAIELFLQYIADTLKNIQADNELILYVYETIKNIECNENSYSKCDNSVDVFDKNEANVFSEIQKVSMDCSNIFRHNFSHIQFNDS